jgi:hypothetical protein
MIRAHQGFQKPLNLPLQPALQLPLQIQETVGHSLPALLIRHGIEDLPEGVDYVDVLGLHPLDAAGHQVSDPLKLRGLKGGPRLQVQHDRGLGRLLLADEQRLLRHAQVDAGLDHLRKLSDGPGQLPLKGPLKVHPLNELSGSEVVPVEDFETDSPALGEPLCGQLQAELIDVLIRYENGTPFILQPIGYSLGAKTLHNGRCILPAQLRIKHLVGGPPTPQD